MATTITAAATAAETNRTRLPTPQTFENSYTNTRWRAHAATISHTHTNIRYTLRSTKIVLYQTQAGSFTLKMS